MSDLKFTYGWQGDFLITAYSERGLQWLAENANAINTELESGTDQPVGKSWIETKGEFERLYAKAAAGGELIVLMKSADEPGNSTAQTGRQPGH